MRSLSSGFLIVGFFLGQGIPSGVGLATADDVPWKRFLTGDHAKQVSELEQRINELYGAGRYADSQEPARQAFEIRAREQGPAHWQTISAKSNLDIITAIAHLPKDAQEALNEIASLERNELPKLQREGRYREAIPIAERIVATRQRYLGNDFSLVATALNGQGMFCYEAAQYSQAEALFRQVLSISQKVYGDSHPNTASAHGNLAMSLEMLDKYEEAHNLKEKALQIQLHAYGEASEATAIAYNNLAGSFENRGQYGEAEAGYRKSLEILLSLQDDHNEHKVATTHSNLAGVLSHQAKYADAEQEYQQALAIQRRLFGDQHPETAITYNNLGVCLADQRKYADAEPLYRQALGIRSRLLGESHLLTLQCYNNLALVLNHRAKFAEAELLLRRALLLQENAGEENRSTAVWHISLAHNLEAQGRLGEAKESLERALVILRRILGEDHPDIAHTTIDLAVNLNDQEKYDEAEPLFRTSVQSLRQHLGKAHPQAAQAYANLGGNLYYQGEYSEAESIQQEVLQIYQQVFGQRHQSTAWAYKNLIIALWVQGKYADVEGLAAPAAESFEGARRHVSIAGLERTTFAADNSPLDLLAAVAARREKPAEAWQFLESDLARGLFDDLATRPWTDAERQHESRLSQQIDELDKQVSALLGTPNITVVSRQKAAELVRRREEHQKELAELQAEMARKYGVVAGEIFDLARVQSQLPVEAALLTWIDFAGQPKGHDPNGEHWACMLRATGTPIWARLPGTGRNGAWTADDDSLAAQVRQECAARPTTTNTRNDLVQKLYAQRLAPLEGQMAASDGLPAVRHLIVLPSSRMRRIPVEVLTEEVHQGRFIVSYAPSGTLFTWLQGQRPSASPDKPSSPSANILAVGDPVFRSSQPPEDPLPLPDDGVLVTMVTPHSNADKHGLKPGDVIVGYAQTKINSSSDLKSAIEKGKESADENRPVSVQAWRDGMTIECEVDPGPLGVMLSSAPANQAVLAQRELDRLMRGSNSSEFSRLKGAEREVQAVTAVFLTATVLTGSEASEQKLDTLAAAGRLGQFRYLHFATHGLLDGKSPMQSALILSQDQLPDPLEQVLAGKPTYDGRLTADQMLRGWKLNADLVTLSACETGLGKFAGGEGYLGFSQALFLCGARSLVLSLWKVDDTSTALLMTRFYENLTGRRPTLVTPMTKVEALAEAKAWLRNLQVEEVEQLSGGMLRGVDTDTARGIKRPQPAKRDETPASLQPYAHSYYWAPFILVGDPR